MKTAYQNNYGAADVLTVDDVLVRPTVRKDDILVNPASLNIQAVNAKRFSRVR